MNKNSKTVKTELMKLRKNILAALLLPAILLVSCVKERYPDDSESEKPDAGTGKYLSARISIPTKTNMANRGAATREEEYIGDNNELLVRGVRMVFYGEASGNVEYCRDIKSYNVDTYNYNGNDYFSPDLFYGEDVYESSYPDWDWDNPSNPYYFVTVATDQIRRGEYKMLVIINPTEKIKALTGIGQPLTALDALATNSAGDYATAEDFMGADFVPTADYISTGPESSYTFAYDNFMMLNMQGLIRIKEGNFYKTELQAQQYPVMAGLERTVARIDMFWEPDNGGGYINVAGALSGTRAREVYWNQFNIYCRPVYNSGASDWNLPSAYGMLSDITWGLDITNLKSFWLRKLTRKAGGGATEQQGDRDRYNFYAEDPNFDGFSGQPMSLLQNEFKYLRTEDVNIDLGSGHDSYYGGYKYILENTMPAAEQRGDVSTRLLIRAVFTENSISVVRRDGKTRAGGDIVANLAEGETFYVFRGGDLASYQSNISSGDAGFFIIRASDMGFYANNPQYIPDGDQLDPDYAGTPATSGPADLVGLQDAIDAVRAQFGAGFDFAAPPASFTVGALECHLNGICFYQAPIRHFGDWQEGNVMGYGRYGVVRNNIYGLTINAIYNLGEAEFPEPTTDPNETPKDIDLKVFVDPWSSWRVEYDFNILP